MFISKLESSESRGNHSLTSKCRFKTTKVHELRYVLQIQDYCRFKTLRIYELCYVMEFKEWCEFRSWRCRNEIEMDKK